ncbi:hypothetical protein BDQ17DRAFT_1364443 [Cyathus striatus]|nr:hypothetical protein BDQ17DRAFT_1364443 [Cyathus striatus]
MLPCGFGNSYRWIPQAVPVGHVRYANGAMSEIAHGHRRAQHMGATVTMDQPRGLAQQLNANRGRSFQHPPHGYNLGPREGYQLYRPMQYLVDPMIFYTTQEPVGGSAPQQRGTQRPIGQSERQGNSRRGEPVRNDRRRNAHFDDDPIVDLHPIIRHPSNISRLPHISWDLSCYPTDVMISPIEQSETLEHSVTSPSCSEMFIKVMFRDRRNPERDKSMTPIHVKASSDPRRPFPFITARDVLRGIYLYFQVTIPESWSILQDSQFLHHFYNRLDVLQDIARSEEERNNGPRIVDYLDYYIGGTQYPGLKIIEVKEGKCKAKLVFT